MRLFIQALVILQSAVIAALLMRYDPAEHYAVRARETTITVLSGMLESCHSLMGSGAPAAPRSTGKDNLSGRA